MSERSVKKKSTKVLKKLSGSEPKFYNILVVENEKHFLSVMRDVLPGLVPQQWFLALIGYDFAAGRLRLPKIVST